jgi:hypothetical protein
MLLHPKKIDWRRSDVDFHHTFMSTAITSLQRYIMSFSSIFDIITSFYMYSFCAVNLQKSTHLNKKNIFMQKL